MTATWNLHLIRYYSSATQTYAKYSYPACPVGWGCRIDRLHLSRGISPLNECPGYDTKQSDGEFPLKLELWEMRSASLLPLLPGSLWPRMVASDKGTIFGLNRTKPCSLHYTDFFI